MSGFEAVGAVLGLWPVVINAFIAYEATKDNTGCDLLLHELETEEIIYREFVHHLLASDVSETDLLQITDRQKPNVGLWKDKALHASLERRLGDKSEVVVKTLKDMDNILATLNEKLRANDTGSVWLYSLKYRLFHGRADKCR
jgi:hypothetical protein